MPSASPGRCRAQASRSPDSSSALTVSTAEPRYGTGLSARPSSWPRIRAAGAFAVNILAEDQRELWRRFAVTGGDKFAGVPWRPGGNGAPLLDGVLATVECTLEGVLDGGDRAIVLGRVTGPAVHRAGEPPLLYFRRAYGRLPSSSMSASMAAARSRSEA
ncbi:flavin reductase family protein [Streptomyces sp. NPDC088762]|uniref:flavin reductase family protein n=1 Tax=Streptomyces sp. NPDC088762 TaxID=3365891 RepID=UPI00380BEC53